jgi:hypothetical protein
MKTDKYLKNYVNGQLVPPFSGEYLENKNPATGDVYSFIPDSNTEDIERAMEAATAAFKDWSTCGVKKRYRILSRIADILEQNAEAFALADSIDTGKSITQSRTLDIPKTYSNLHQRRGVHQLYLESTNWSCSLYDTLEFSNSVFYMENCTGFSDRKLCNCQTFRVSSNDNLYVF